MGTSPPTGMGAVMACCAGEALCCIGGTALSCCGRACQCTGAMGYPIFIFLAAVLAIVIRFFLISDLDSMLKHLGTSSVCGGVNDEDAKNACYGNQFVYREGFALVLFFAFMMLCVACCRKAAHDGMWCAKVGLASAIWIA